MHVSLTAWLVTIVALALVMFIDIVIIGRRPHEPGMAECAIAIGVYVGLAVAFGVGVGLVSGGEYAGEFFAGWITEYSLSIDNLFVFIIIMGALKVPRAYQQSALLIGIVLALVLRGVFIAIGAAVIHQFSWVFYLFGAFLVYTAIDLARHRGEDSAADGYTENRLIRFARTRLPFTADYHGTALTARAGGRRLATPMLLVVAALGTTDLLFALDSIPAIFGLTREPYLVFTANVFALMGLRQLYFLIGGLLDRLVYLKLGLAVVLGFIGLKLVFHALHENTVPFVNAGQSVTWAPDLGIAASLTVIGVTLAVTVVASLLRSRRGSRLDATGGDDRGDRAIG